MRLRPYTSILPKPLIPVGNEPILEHIIRRLYMAGVRSVDLCLGRHLGGLIQTYFSHVTTLPDGLRVSYHWEDAPQGTAGALRTITGLTDSFIVMNGDILTTLDYRALLAAHSRSGAALTIATHREVVDVSLGVLECDDARVTGYREKPSLGFDVSMGIYVYEPRALALLPPDGVIQFPDLVLRLIEAGEHVASYRSDDLWYDIGTVTEYERALRDLQEQPDLFAA